MNHFIYSAILTLVLLIVISLVFIWFKHADFILEKNILLHVWIIVAFCTIIGCVLIAVGGIVISQKTETTYKDLLKEAQEKYFDVIDKTFDKNVQKKIFILTLIINFIVILMVN